MKTVKIFTPDNRLAKVIDSPDGISFAELVGDAEARVETLAEGIGRYVDEQIAVIAAIQVQGELVIFGESLALSRAALNIAEIAGAAGHEALGEVARGVCAMVDGLLASGIWHSDALDLHLTSLSLLNDPTPPDAVERERIIKRLADMRRAVGIPD